jgi:hypothetical protein
MRVRVTLDFDILIESFISLCNIETVGAIFREYKPWIAFFSKEKATKKPIVSFDGFGCVLHFSAPYYEW